MAALNTLHPSLRIELPGIIEPALADAVRETAQDFLRRTGVWKYTVPSLLDWTTAAVFPTLTAGTEIPDDTRVSGVDEVKFSAGGTNLKTVAFATRNQLDNDYPDWEIKEGNCPRRWTSDGPGNWRIVPKAEENKTGSLQLRVVLTLSDSAVALPDFILYEFKDALRYGTLARLMKIPGKDWTNLKAAGAYASAYENEVTKARGRAQAEFGKPRREVQYGGL